MESTNKYIQYIESHPDLQQKFNQLWIERFYQNYKPQEYIARFFVLKHNNVHIGIVESERPNSATYLYSFSSEYINLCCYIYMQDFADPYINRDYSKEDKKTLHKLVEIKDNYGIEEFYNEHLVPIKKRCYFSAEIKHSTFQEWSNNLERNIKLLECNLYKTDYSFRRLISHLTKREKCFDQNEYSNKSITNKQKKNKNAKKNIKHKKEYDPAIYFNKSIYEIGKILDIHPFRLQTILTNRNKLNIESTKQILTMEEVSLCKNTLSELFYLKKKKDEKINC